MILLQKKIWFQLTSNDIMFDSPSLWIHPICAKYLNLCDHGKPLIRINVAAPILNRFVDLEKEKIPGVKVIAIDGHNSHVYFIRNLIARWKFENFFEHCYFRCSHAIGKEWLCQAIGNDLEKTQIELLEQKKRTLVISSRWLT